MFLDTALAGYMGRRSILMSYTPSDPQESYGIEAGNLTEPAPTASPPRRVSRPRGVVYMKLDSVAIWLVD